MRKLYKLKAVLLFCVLLLALPFSTSATELGNNDNITPYGAGEWDNIAYGFFDLSTTPKTLHTFTSGGGDLRICLASVDPLNSIYFNIYTTSGINVAPLFFKNYDASTVSEEMCLPKFSVAPYVNSDGKVNLYITGNAQKNDTIVLKIQD